MKTFTAKYAKWLELKSKNEKGGHFAIYIGEWLLEKKSENLKRGRVECE
jgi:hypothetical protein